MGVNCVLVIYIWLQIMIVNRVRYMIMVHLGHMLNHQSYKTYK
jgi:hypothetical protein